MAERVKEAFQGIKRIIYSKTNFKDLHAKFTNSSQDRCIRFYIRYIFSLKIFRWIAFNNILQL